MTSASEFSTDQVFNSNQELVEWAQNVARSLGYVLVTKRSKKKNGYLSKIILMCDRGGVYRSSDRGDKETASKKIDCKFELVGKYYKIQNFWMLTVKCPEHNHEPAMYMEGHPYARRLTDHELSLVATMTSQNLKARDILSTLKNLNEENVSTSRTIYNAQQKLRLAGHEGRTPIQVVFSFLQEKGYHFEYRTNDSTNKLEELFFVHPISLKILLAFPHVLLMDATYKTNKFNLPLLEIVGVTSTSKTFSIAFVLLDQEKKPNFIWALNCLKLCIGKSYMSRVIITNRDLALMNACDQVFPNANKLLCRWHIDENIAKHCRPSFKSQVEYDSFKHLWDEFVKAPTLVEYQLHYSNLQVKLINHLDTLKYLHKVWLDPHEKKFVSIMTDKYLNFGNSTNNRVEGQHSKVKLYLASSKSRLDRLISVIDQVVLSQYTSIKESIEKSRIFRQHNINHPQFQELWGLVSQTALEQIFKELNRSDGLELTYENCGCRLRSSYGLPCAHELILHFNANEPIPLQSVDVFWRKLDLEPSIPVEDVDLDFDNEVQNFKKSFEKQSPFGKFNFLKKFKAIYESKETLVGEPEYHKDNRGLPSLKKTKKLHLPTHNPPNTSSVVGSELFDLNKEPARHSMYVNQTSYPNQSYYADPFMSETQTHNPDPYMYTTQPYYADPFMSETQTHNPDPYMCTTQPYYVDPYMKDPDFLIQQGLKDFIPYITQVHNVEGDGNCGFRAIAACLGGHQDSWPKIRMDLLDELSVHNEAYTLIFHKEGVQLLQYILNHFKKGQAPTQHWMVMPDTGLLIASRYNVVVIFLSKEGETTCLPLFSSPPKSQPHHICVISRFHGIHFVRLELQGDFPIPPTHPQWSSNAFDRTWENPYLHRQNVYNQLKFPNRNSGCVKTHINIED